MTFIFCIFELSHCWILYCKYGKNIHKETMKKIGDRLVFCFLLSVRSHMSFFTDGQVRFTYRNSGYEVLPGIVEHMLIYGNDNKISDFTV